MIEVLEFIFQDFKHWAGTIILIGSIGVSLAMAFVGKK